MATTGSGQGIHNTPSMAGRVGSCLTLMRRGEAGLYITRPFMPMGDPGRPAYSEALHSFDKNVSWAQRRCERTQGASGRRQLFITATKKASATSPALTMDAHLLDIFGANSEKAGPE
jgi:hypothetical protein